MYVKLCVRLIPIGVVLAKAGYVPSCRGSCGFLWSRLYQGLRRSLGQLRYLFYCFEVRHGFQQFVLRALVRLLWHVRPRGTALVASTHAVVEEDQGGHYLQAFLLRLVRGTQFNDCSVYIFKVVRDMLRRYDHEACRIHRFRRHVLAFKVYRCRYFQVLYFRFRSLFGQGLFICVTNSIPGGRVPIHG